MSNAWLETVRALAQHRAQAEERQRRGALADLVPFNGRWEHVQSVVRLATWLAAEMHADAEVVVASAWLHDICKGQSRHAERAAQETPAILTTTDFPAEKITFVVDVIRKHEGLFKEHLVEPLEAAVLWDADKLSKLGAEATLQFVATYAGPSRALSDWLAEQERYMDLAGKIAASMNTPPAQRLARQRLITMRRWLDDLYNEMEL